jgi:hypothetical protein
MATEGADVQWRNMNPWERDRLLKRCRSAVFAVVLAHPHSTPDELRPLVRAAFRERGLPIAGHDLRLTLARLIRTGAIVDVGEPGHSRFCISPEVEADFAARVAARAAGLEPERTRRRI